MVTIVRHEHLSSLCSVILRPVAKGGSGGSIEPPKYYSLGAPTVTSLTRYMRTRYA